WEVHLGLILVCLFVSCPALYALQIATLTLEEAFSVPPRVFPPSTDLWNNVQDLFTSGNFDMYIRNTLIVTFVVVVGKTALAMLAGMAFVYFNFPGKWFLFFFVLLTLLMPTEIIILPLFELMSNLRWGSENPRLAMTMPFLASAVGAFLFRQHF